MVDIDKSQYKILISIVSQNRRELGVGSIEVSSFIELVDHHQFIVLSMRVYLEGVLPITNIFLNAHQESLHLTWGSI